MTVRSPLVLFLSLAFVPTVVFLAFVPASRLPQVASGGDVLSVVFGDAKAVLSAALVHKADSYFHGGVDEDGPDGRGGDDLWARINRGVRAPEVGRHLQGVKAVEMLPWFWASVKANPHNIEAWTATWYSAAHIMKDDALARRVLDEAKAKNPASAEIWFTEGRFLYRNGRGDLAAARVSFGKARELLLASCGGDVARLSERDRQTYDFTENYLRKLSHP